MSHAPKRAYRGGDHLVSRRTLSAGVLTGSGILLAVVHILHGIENLQAGVGLYGLVLGVVGPALLAGALVVAGYRLWQSDVTSTQLQRIVGWFFVGTVGMLFLAGSAVVYEQFHGAQLTHLPFVLVNVATGGGLVGIILGWYDVQNRMQTKELRVFREAVEHSGHSIYITEPDGTIEYVNPAYEDQTGYDREEAVGDDPSILQSGEHDDAFYEELWETILSGEVWTGEAINQTRDGENYVVNQTIAPVTDEHSEVEHFVAINADVSDQRRRQRELERQRDELVQLHRLTGTMWEVTQALASAATESELRQQVCDALVSTEFCDAAWISTYDQPTETLTPASSAGIDKDALASVSLSESQDETAEQARLAQDAVEQRDVTIAEGQTEAVSLWHSQDEHNRATTTIPIVRDDLVYGTVTICSSRENAFENDERDHLARLGEAVAHGLDSIKTRKLLHANQVVELGCRTSDERDLFVDASERAGCSLSLSGTVPLSDDRALLYVTLTEGSVEELRELTETREDVDRLRVIDEGDETTLTLVVEPDALVAKRLTALGAQIDQAEASDGEVTITAYLTPDQSVRSIVEEVQETFPSFELVAKRETERSTDEDDERSPQTQLSERQRAALHAAYHAGYFRSPRKSTAEEIASEMGVAGPTFHKHLRRAQKQLLDTLLNAHPQGLDGPQTQSLQI